MKECDEVESIEVGTTFVRLIKKGLSEEVKFKLKPERE